MQSDRSLIKYLLSNDESTIHYAFKCVYDKYYKLVTFCISQYVKNHEDQEELANDTFLSLFNNLDKLDVNRNLKYYILTIAKNKALTHLKKDAKYCLVSDEVLINIPYEDEYESNDLINKLKKVLTKDELQIVIYHLIYDYSFKEIAKQKDVSINTIMSKYRRSLQKAYKYLSKE